MVDKLPNVFVVGVGHTGTTVATKMLGSLGWQIPYADKRYAENTMVRNLNTQALAKGQLPVAATEALEDLKQYEPWCIKDPRFVVTLHLWAQRIQELQLPLPTVLHLTKPLARVQASYRRRGEMVRGQPGIKWRGSTRGLTVSELIAAATQQVSTWPGPKFTVDYDQISAAVALFKPR